MSPDRSRSRGREAVPSDAGSYWRNPSMRLPPPHLRDHHRARRSRPYPQPVIGGRSLHQIQLELEYDAEESDNDSDRPMMPRWPSALERHQALDDPAEHNVRQIHALCTFDEITVPTVDTPRSVILDTLIEAPVQRKWGRWRWRGHPRLGNLNVVEAVAIYERGLEQGNSQRCSRCRTGQGVSPACVVAPEIARAGGDSGACSNCIYDGIGYACDVAERKTRQGFNTEPARDAEAVVDHMAVLEMIAGLKRPSGARRDQSLPSKAKRIEMAALHIAQAARDWGQKMEEQH